MAWCNPCCCIISSNTVWNLIGDSQKLAEPSGVVDPTWGALLADISGVKIGEVHL